MSRPKRNFTRDFSDGGAHVFALLVWPCGLTTDAVRSTGCRSCPSLLPQTDRAAQLQPSERDAAESVQLEHAEREGAEEAGVGALLHGVARGGREGPRAGGEAVATPTGPAT